MLDDSLHQMKLALTASYAEGNEKNRSNDKKQLDNEIQQFERRNKLLSGIYKQKSSAQKIDEQCNRFNERMQYADARNNKMAGSNEDVSESSPSQQEVSSSQYQGLMTSSFGDKSGSFKLKNILV